MKLTLDSFKKAAKRHAAQTGKPLATAQEELAALLGFQSFHAVTQRLGSKAAWQKITPLHIGACCLALAAALLLPSLFGTASDTFWGTSPRSTRPSASRAAASAEAASAFASIKHTVSLEIDTPDPLTQTARSMLNACQAPCKAILQSTSIGPSREYSAVSFWMPLQAKDGFIRSMESLGALRASKVDWVDVSRELALSTAQRDNLRSSRDKLREMLDQTKAQDSTLKIQDELRQTQARLDEASAARNELEMQATTLIVEVNLSRTTPEPDLLEKLVQDAKQNFMSGVDFVVNALSFGLPLLTSGGLCWLAFEQVESLIKRRKLAAEGKASGAGAKPKPSPGPTDSAPRPSRASPDDDGSNCAP